MPEDQLSGELRERFEEAEELGRSPELHAAFSEAIADPRLWDKPRATRSVAVMLPVVSTVVFRRREPSRPRSPTSSSSQSGLRVAERSG